MLCDIKYKKVEVDYSQYSRPIRLGCPFCITKISHKTRTYKSFAKRLGLAGAKVHDLRHFHASVMLQNGQTLLLVSKRLGHASVATTGDIYGHLLPGWQKEAASAFAKAMKEG